MFVYFRLRNGLKGIPALPKAEFDLLIWSGIRGGLQGRGEDSAGDSIDRRIGHLESRFTGERIRLEEGALLSGSLDPNWGRQGI